MPTDRTLLLISTVLQGAVSVTFSLAFFGLWRGLHRDAARRFGVVWGLYALGVAVTTLTVALGPFSPTIPPLLPLPIVFSVFAFRAASEALLETPAAGVARVLRVSVAAYAIYLLMWAVLGTRLATLAPTFVPFMAPRLMMAAGYAWAAWPLLRRWADIGNNLRTTGIALTLLALRAGASATYEIVRVAQGRAGEPESLVLTVAQLVLLIAFGVSAVVVIVDGEREEAVHAAATIRRTAEELQASEARFRFVVEHASDMQLVIGPDDRIRYAAPNTLRLLGVPAADLHGTNLLSRVPREDYDVASQALRALRERQTPDAVPASIRLWHADGGTRTFEINGEAAHEPGEADASLLLTAHDVTRQRQLERQLQQNDRLDRLGQMAGSMAHDFNNMLQGIKTGLTLAMRSVPAGAPVTDYLTLMDDAVERGQTLTSQLLAFARQAPDEMRTFDMAERLHALEGLLKIVGGSAIRVTVETSGGAMPVQANPGQFDQAVVNLTANARDAMPEGGTVAVRAERGTDVARLTVTDTGVGIPPEQLDQIFQPFFTTKASGRGTGLGLASTYGFARQFNGTLTVESRPGAGSCFALELPLATTAPEAAVTA
jgi:PAS domain S-box-containing protein